MLLCSTLKQQSAIKFLKKQTAKQKSSQNKPKKQANFNLNKQSASPKKKRKSTKKQAKIRGKTA